MIARRSCKLYSAIDSCLLCVFFRCPCTRCSMTGFGNSILKLFSKRIHSIKLSDFVATAISGLVTFTYCRYNNTLSMDQCSLQYKWHHKQCILFRLFIWGKKSPPKSIESSNNEYPIQFQYNDCVNVTMLFCKIHLMNMPITFKAEPIIGELKILLASMIIAVSSG